MKITKLGLAAVVGWMIDAAVIAVHIPEFLHPAPAMAATMKVEPVYDQQMVNTSEEARALGQRGYHVVGFQLSGDIESHMVQKILMEKRTR